MSGRIIVPGEIKQQARSTQKVLNVYKTAITNVMIVLKDTIDDNNLEGEAISEIKSQFKTHRDILKGMSGAISEAIQDSISLVQNVGNEYLDEDNILFKIKLLEKLNRTYNSFIESYRRALKNPVYAEVFGAWAQCEIVKYSMLIYLNDRQISKYKKKLSQIEAIDLATRNLFSTDLSSYIMQGVNLLSSAWNGENYTTILGGKWKDLLQEAWEKYENEGITTGLSETGFVKIVDENGNVIGFGGDQGWYRDSDLDYINNSGCGLIALANTILYMRGVTEISKEDYMAFLEELRQKHKLIDVNLDTLGTGMLTPYIQVVLQKELAESGMDIDFKWNTGGDRLDKIKQTLEQNIPVILEIGEGNGSLELQLYRYNENSKEYEQGTTTSMHYVTVTAVKEYVNPDTGDTSTMLEISTWGDKYYIDYDEYLKFIQDSTDGKIDSLYENIYNNIYYVEGK